MLAALALATTAQAVLFNYTGSFDSAMMLGGTTLGADTPFSITATFDSFMNYGYTVFTPAGTVDVDQVTSLSLPLSAST